MSELTHENHDNICFVISPIGEPNSETRKDFDRVLKHIITPAAKECNLITIRADQISSPGMITSQIIRHILNDKMVVADLTLHNANVFYELALRHAFRKPIVLIIKKGEEIPFDIQGTRIVKYTLEIDDVVEAKEEIKKQMESSLLPDTEIESPVTNAAQIDELMRTSQPENQIILNTLSNQIENMNKTLSEMSKTICKPDDINNSIPPLIKDHLEETLRKYGEEIDLLKSIRYAGISGIYKRREMGIKAFMQAIDEESSSIWVVGSSLKGLLQKNEYKQIAEKLRFKVDRGLVQVNFLLTHPIIADFRASQERRNFTEIGMEIINTLEILKEWNRSFCNVRLYLGTPTCFAIKTTNKMLINPYPYNAVAFDSPCFIIDHSSKTDSERPNYIYDEFNIRHFGAWDTDLAIEVKDFQRTIDILKSNLLAYADKVKTVLQDGNKII